MRSLTFAARTAREILRDPLNLSFGLGFPIILMLLLSAIQANIEVELFGLSHLTPGVAVFGLSFMTLFSSLIVAKDRESALLQRLYTTPLTASDFIVGYILPLIPIGMAQGVITYILGIILGLEVNINLLWAIIFLIPVSLFHTSLGLLCGSAMSSKQVGGFCGALMTNLSGWLAGVWFDLDILGEGFKSVAELFPFCHAVEMEEAVFTGNFEGIFPHLWWVLGYTAAEFIAAVLLFLRQMRKN